MALPQKPAVVSRPVHQAAVVPWKVALQGIPDKTLAARCIYDCCAEYWTLEG